MAQVRSLKTGIKFKDTPIGKIPVDWAVSRLGDLCVGKPEYGANVSAIDKDENLPRYVRITDINDDGYLLNEKWQSINRDVAKAYMLKIGNLLFARSGATVGKTYLYRKEDGECAFAGYLIRFTPNAARLLPALLFHFTHSNIYYQWVKGMLRAGAQPNINGKEYSDLIIPLPPLPEQKKIAEILSNVDGAIEETDRIIEKTKELKKGLMQELLSRGIGHKKFKKTEIGEIPQEWDFKPFIEVMVLQRGFDLPVQNRISGHYLILASNGVIDCHNEFKVKGPGVITGRSGSLGKVHYIETNYWPLNTTLYVKNFFNNDPKFLYYFLQSFKIDKFGTGTGVPTLNRNIVHKINVAIPPLKEQKEIAKILSFVDLDIEKEESKKQKLKELKKSLMQVLLTGKVRVKIG